jgi:hypothetical protein
VTAAARPRVTDHAVAELLPTQMAHAALPRGHRIVRRRRFLAGIAMSERASSYTPPTKPC